MDENKIIQKVVEIDAEVKEMHKELGSFVTRSEFNNTMDRAMTILERLDGERVFTGEWVKRIESDVKRHQKEIKELKQHLGLS